MSPSFLQDVRERLTDHEALPSLEETKAQIAKDMNAKLSTLQETRETAIHSRLSSIREELDFLKARQIQERSALVKSHGIRRQSETTMRQSRYNKGLKGFVDIFTGKRRKIAKQNLKETQVSEKRDQKEIDKLIFSHLDDTRTLTGRLNRLEEFGKTKNQTLNHDIFQYQEIRRGQQDKFEQHKSLSKSRPSLER